MILKRGKPEDVGMSGKQISKLEKLVAGWVEEGHYPAAAYMVARNGIIVSHGAEGYLDAGKSIPLPPDALFSMASITKLVTATAIMILTEDGLLSPVCPIQDFIPEFWSSIDL